MSQFKILTLAAGFWMSLTTSWAAGLEVGTQAPEFTAKIQDGTSVVLKQYVGKPVLIYFYPKDETPGCTKQACRLRDEFAKFKEYGAVVLGVSTQSVESHKAFKEHHKLPFDLISDEDRALARLYRIESMPLVGLLKRQSVLLDKDHRVLKFYASVDPQKHPEEVLTELKKGSQTKAK